MINKFFDKKYSLITGILVILSVVGFVSVFEMLSGVRVKLPLGIIFMVVGVYGFTRACIKDRKKKKKDETKKIKV